MLNRWRDTLEGIRRGWRYRWGLDNLSRVIWRRHRLVAEIDYTKGSLLKTHYDPICKCNLDFLKETL